MNRTISLTLACLALLAFAACGGGGSGPEPYDGPLTVPHDGGPGNLGDDPVGGSGGSTGGGGGGLSFRVLVSGELSQATTPQTMIARDQSEFAAVWLAYTGGLPTFAGPPMVDFSQETVIAVFLGTRPTGGYSVRIADIVPEGDGVRVTVEETQPGPNCIVTQALTYPCVIVAVPRYEGSTAFDFTTVTNNCP